MFTIPDCHEQNPLKLGTPFFSASIQETSSGSSEKTSETIKDPANRTKTLLNNYEKL